jgi:predicted transcriptional regulator
LKNPNGSYEKEVTPNGTVKAMKLNKTDEQVVAALKESKELTLAEISDKIGVPSKKVFKSLKKLFEAEMIDSNARKYRLLTDKPPKKSEDDAAGADE